MSVVPVSTMPAFLDRIVEFPYAMVWSIPQYALAGDVLVVALFVEKCQYTL